MLNLHRFLLRVWIIREAVVPITNTVTVTIAVLLVHDAIAVVVAVRAAALPMLPVIALTIAIALIATGCGRLERLGLHIHRCRLQVDARHLHADGKLHIATGVRR